MSIVLVIEDERSHAKLFRDYLYATGWSPVLAYDAPQALQLAQEITPAAILLDILLPSIDGRDLLVELRRIPALAETPIIAVSALTELHIKDSCLAAGADIFLAKPLSLSNLGKQLLLLTQRP